MITFNSNSQPVKKNPVPKLSTQRALVFKKSTTMTKSKKVNRGVSNNNLIHEAVEKLKFKFESTERIAEIEMQERLSVENSISSDESLGADLSRNLT